MNFEKPKVRELILGENRDRLSLKLEEYLTRQGNEKYNQKRNDYEIEILKPLIANGRVNLDDVKNRLKAQEGKEFDDFNFGKAAGIIEDYIQTGGKHLRGGTGLPNVPQADLEEGEIK